MFYRRAYFARLAALRRPRTPRSFRLVGAVILNGPFCLIAVFISTRCNLLTKPCGIVIC